MLATLSHPLAIGRRTKTLRATASSICHLASLAPPEPYAGRDRVASALLRVLAASRHVGTQLGPYRLSAHLPLFRPAAHAISGLAGFLERAGVPMSSRSTSAALMFVYTSSTPTCANDCERQRDTLRANSVVSGGFRTAVDDYDASFSHSHGRGRWFETSIAHPAKALFCGQNGRTPSPSPRRLRPF